MPRSRSLTNAGAPHLAFEMWVFAEQSVQWPTEKRRHLRSHVFSTFHTRMLDETEKGDTESRVARQPRSSRQCAHHLRNKVADEDGPPDFLMRCILVDLKTGLEVENYGCFSELPKNPPVWLESLEKVR